VSTRAIARSVHADENRAAGGAMRGGGSGVARFRFLRVDRALTACRSGRA
jgi:hypothetical protein